MHTAVETDKGRLRGQVAREMQPRNRVQGPCFSGIECKPRVLFMCITKRLDAQLLTAPVYSLYSGNAFSKNVSSWHDVRTKGWGSFSLVKIRELYERGKLKALFSKGFEHVAVYYILYYFLVRLATNGFSFQKKFG